VARGGGGSAQKARRECKRKAIARRVAAWRLKEEEAAKRARCQEDNGRRKRESKARRVSGSGASGDASLKADDTCVMAGEQADGRVNLPSRRQPPFSGCARELTSDKDPPSAALWPSA